jgi:hypothetical protein
MVYGKLFPRAVVAVFYGTRRDTGMTIDTFFFINLDDRRQRIFFHKAPPLSNISQATYRLFCASRAGFKMEFLI